MRDDYDFSKGVKGKYAERYKEGTNIVLIDPDIAKELPNAEAVNDALRLLMKVARTATSMA